MALGVYLEEDGTLMTDLPLPRASYWIMASMALRCDRLHRA